MDKPVFILIHGFSSSNVWWKYKDVKTNELQKLTFYDELKKIGDVYEHNMEFFNIIYYYTVKNEKEKERMRIIYKKYKPHTPQLNFKIKDLLYENICHNIHNNAMQIYGKNRKYVLVCHSYGCLIGLLYSKIYKNECLFNVMIDNSPYYLKLFEEMFNSKYTKKDKENVDKYLYDDEQLKITLKKIKNKKIDENVNAEINMVFSLISYNDWIERIKHYNKKLPIYTLYFRATYPNATAKFKIECNKWGLEEEKIMTKYNSENKLEYIKMPNAEHYIWFKQKYSDDIISKIKETLNKFI